MPAALHPLPPVWGGVGNSREHHSWGHRLLFPTICMTKLSALPLGSQKSSGAERTSPGREAVADAGSRTRVPQVRLPPCQQRAGPCCDWLLMCESGAPAGKAHVAVRVGVRRCFAGRRAAVRGAGGMFAGKARWVCGVDVGYSWCGVLRGPALSEPRVCPRVGKR